MHTVTRDDFAGNTYPTLEGGIKPGDTISWGRFAPSYVTDGAQLIHVLDWTGWGDYVGTTYTRANHDYLVDNYGDYLVRVGYSTHDGMSLAVVVGSDIPDDLVDILVGLADYPCIDDDRLAYIERELEDETVTNYLVRDWTDDDHEDEDELVAAYYDLRADGCLYWGSEGSTSGHVEIDYMTDKTIPDDVPGRDRVAWLVRDHADELDARRRTA